MEIYNTDYALYVQDGEHDPKQVTNFTPVIETAYFNLEGPQDIPAYLGIELILEDGSMRRLTLPMTSNLARRIVAEEPRAILLKSSYAPPCPETYCRSAFQDRAPRRVPARSLPAGQWNLPSGG